MTYIIKIYSPPLFDTVEWTLRYCPESSTPFTTLQGTEHVWVWDFITGAFLKDGETLVNHTVEISKEETNG